jgi:hypothetical protein
VKRSCVGIFTAGLIRAFTNMLRAEVL